MKPADDYQEVRDGLWCWQAYDPSVKADLWSTALRAGDRLVFIDPIPLEPLARLTAALQPAGIIVTNANHQRAAAEYRTRFDIPVWSAAKLDCVADRQLEDGEAVWEELEIIGLPGAVTGEIAVYSPQGGGIMMMGDALIHLDPLAFLPDKYCQEPKRMKVSLQKLLRFRFDLMTFAHGTPVPSGAKKRLQELFP